MEFENVIYGTNIKKSFKGFDLDVEELRIPMGPERQRCCVSLLESGWTIREKSNILTRSWRMWRA